MKYNRLIDKVRRYEKYKDAYGIDCGTDMLLAMYSGNRKIGEMIFVVTPSTQTQVVITERKGDLVRYRLAESADREKERLANLAAHKQEGSNPAPKFMGEPVNPSVEGAALLENCITPHSFP